MNCLALLLCALPISAQETQTEVLFPGRPSEMLDLARDGGRLQREFSAWALEETDDDQRGEVTRWAFTPRAETSFNDLFFRPERVRPFDTLVLRVRNVGAAFTLTVKIVDAHGAEYTPKGVEVSAGGEWQTVRLPMADFGVASWSRDSDGALDWPMRAMAIIAFGIEAGVACELLIGEIAVERPQPARVTVQSAFVPETCDAGDRLRVSAVLVSEGPSAQEDEITLRLLRDGATVSSRIVRPPKPTTEWVAGGTIEVSGSLKVPTFAWGGSYDVHLSVGWLDLGDEDRNDGVIGTVNVKGREAKPVKSEVRNYRGAPTLFINGEPNAAMVYMTYQPNSKYYGQFGRQGVHLYSFPSTCSRHTWQGFARQAWLGPGDNFDFSQLDEQVLKILDADPNAYLFPRVYVNSPDWWDELHPDQLVLYDDGGEEPKLFHETGNKPCPSWASDIWREDTAYALRKYIEHVRRSPYADRVVGYHVASGTTEEWMYWGANEDKYCDYSKPTLEAFRRWLRREHKTDEGLAQAWGNADVTLETAEIPRFAKRSSTEHGVFRDPTSARDVIDFQIFLSDLTAETINYFARTVKDATGGDSLFGTFYGYVLQLFYQRQQNAGHLSPRAVWKSPDVDFLTSPTSYTFRGLDDGYSHFMSLTDGMKLHGKMWFDENDIRTWLTGGETGAWGKTDSYEDTLKMEEREFANVICNACGQWWFDMGGGWYDDERILEDIGRMRKAAESTVTLNRSNVDEIAFIVDPHSLAYLQSATGVPMDFMAHQLPELGRCGAPFGYYTLDDLPDIGPRKLYIMACVWAPTEAQRKLIDRHCKRDGQTIIWLYAAGLVRDGKLDESAMEELTGMKLRYSEEPAKLMVTLEGMDVLMDGIPDGTIYGRDRVESPVIFAADEQVYTLGSMADGKAGFSVRRFDDWTSIFSAAPMVPAELIRNIAREAGAHIYVDSNDAIYANRSLLSLVVNEPGLRTIRLPRQAVVTDLLTGETVATNASQFTVDMPKNGTKIWRVR